MVQKCFTYQVLQKAVYFGYFIYSFVLCTSCIILHLQIPYECIKIRSLDTNYDSNSNFVVYRKKYNDGDAHLLQFSQNVIVQLHSWQFLSFGKRKNFDDDTNFAETPPSALQENKIILVWLNFVTEVSSFIITTPNIHTSATCCHATHATQ